ISDFANSGTAGGVTLFFEPVAIDLLLKKSGLMTRVTPQVAAWGISFSKAAKTGPFTNVVLANRLIKPDRQAGRCRASSKKRISQRAGTHCGNCRICGNRNRWLRIFLLTISTAAWKSLR